MSKYDRVDIQTRWSKKECEVAVRRCESTIRFAKMRMQNTDRRYFRGNTRYSTEYITREIVETEKVLRMWQERLREYE